VIYHNTFVNSLLYVETRNKTRFTPRNSWDNGLEGNYWSFYRGVDVDEDGIGDTPYVVGENNIDNYPLMGTFSNFTVALGENIYSISIISNSTISQFLFSPDDERISLMATAVNETMGFARIAVPNAFLQDLGGGDLSFLINGEQLASKREWMDGVHAYFYFSYVNSVSQLPINPWTIIVGVSGFVIVLVSVLIVLKKKLGMRSRRA